MKKLPKKTTLRNKLDRLCSQIVRARGRCQLCGKTDTLQTAHIFSRTYSNTRWDLDNLLCLCASHHFYYHKNPLIFAEWVRAYLGEEKYNDLKETRNQTIKYTIDDLQTKIKVLTSMLKIC